MLVELKNEFAEVELTKLTFGTYLILLFLREARGPKTLAKNQRAETLSEKGPAERSFSQGCCT